MFGRLLVAVVFVAGLCGLHGLEAPLAHAQGNTFSEVGPSSGATGYERMPSASYQTVIDFQLASLSQPVPGGPPSLVNLPVEPRGWPGVAVLDYDGDGDLDILATNGPGGGNTLHQNQLAQSGAATYVDVAAAAGIDTVDMDANGVCYGDTDNDGDPDVLLLGREEPNRFFENNGDGTFSHSSGNGLDLDSLSHPSCTMGDVDGDGLLDVFVANSFPYDVGFVAIFVEPWALNQPNQLYFNNGDGSFRDESPRIALMDNIPPGFATITWATSMVDVDQDGDTDIVFGDDSGGIPVGKYGGVDRSFIHIMYNDGAGNFEPYSIFERPESPGSWMGLGFGDMDHDGDMDIFGSNFGDYGLPMIGMPYQFGDQQTRPVFARGDGSFEDVEIAAASAFGWGNAVFDIENDGDSDAMYHGSIDMEFLAVVDNPGIVMINDGAGNLVNDVAATGARHLQRNVHGAAIGDLDRDGFVDMVSVSNFDVYPGTPMIPGPAQYGDVLDQFEFFTPAMAPTDPSMQFFVWTGISYANGTLSIDRNNGESGYGSVSAAGTGTVGITDNGAAPRDGTGAVFTFTPRGSSITAMMPITAGSSHTSAHAQEAYFGLGTANRGTLDVTWPGATRNRLYAVGNGEAIDFPELGCSYDTDDNFGQYVSCVAHSLNDLRREGVTSQSERRRLFVSAMVAYFDN